MRRLEPGPLRARLLAWYRASRRDLPWRRTHDPYAVWISEVMLQQTRVETVIPYYERFLTRFPDVARLAAADPAEVRAAWSGLGYYRRAKLMMDAARLIVERHHGRLPDMLETLRALPGFGRYTAGAVAAIAFDRPAPAVDGNVTRVLARVLGLEGDPTRGDVQRAVWEAAEALAPGEAPGELVQALIELGARLCTPKSPRCEQCPARSACAAHQQGRTDSIPPPRKRAARRSLELTALLIMRGDDQVLLEKQPADGLFAELWCLPLLEGRLDASAAIDEAARRHGWSLDRFEPVAALKHVLTHRDLLLEVGRAWGEVQPAREQRFVALAKLDELGVPSVTVKLLQAALPRAALGRAKLTTRKSLRQTAQARLQLGEP